MSGPARLFPLLPGAAFYRVHIQHGPAYAAELPDTKGLSLADKAQRFGEAWAVIFCAADGMGEDAPALGFLKRVALEIKILLGC
jgi:hypothetical protein